MAVPGITATGQLRLSGTSGGDTEVVTVVSIADFVNGVYTRAGSPVAVGSIISDPSGITANGLEIPRGEADAVISILGAFRDDLFELWWTIVLGFDYFDYPNQHPMILRLMQLSGNIGLHVQGGSGGQIRVDDQNNTVLRATVHNDIPPNGYVPPAIYKLAITRTPAKLVSSIAGLAIEQDVAAVETPVLIDALIGGENDGSTWDAFNLRYLEIRPPVDDADLPGLSA